VQFHTGSKEPRGGRGGRKVCEPRRMINGAARRHSQSLSSLIIKVLLLDAPAALAHGGAGSNLFIETRKNIVSPTFCGRRELKQACTIGASIWAA
jgi:hypothetical protein